MVGNYKKKCNFAPSFQERCRSGRSGRSRKPLYGYPYPGFESLSFRNRLRFRSQLFLFIGIVNHICRPTSDSDLYMLPTAGHIGRKRDNTRRHRLHEKAALPHIMPDIPVCRLYFRRFRYKYLQNSSSSEECRNFALAT